MDERVNQFLNEFPSTKHYIFNLNEMAILQKLKEKLRIFEKKQKNVLVVVEEEIDLQYFFQVIREILKVSSMDLKYYFESLVQGEKPNLKIASNKQERK